MVKSIWNITVLGSWPSCLSKRPPTLLWLSWHPLNPLQQLGWILERKFDAMEAPLPAVWSFRRTRKWVSSIFLYHCVTNGFTVNAQPLLRASLHGPADTSDSSTCLMGSWSNRSQWRKGDLLWGRCRYYNKRCLIASKSPDWLPWHWTVKKYWHSDLTDDQRIWTSSSSDACRETGDCTGFARIVGKLYKNVRYFQALTLARTLSWQSESQLRRGCDMARGDDAGNLKWAVVGWITEIYGPVQSSLKVIPKPRTEARKNDFSPGGGSYSARKSEWSWRSKVSASHL